MRATRQFKEEPHKNRCQVITGILPPKRTRGVRKTKTTSALPQALLWDRPSQEDSLGGDVFKQYAVAFLSLDLRAWE